jgi:hypothetical protein
MRARPSRPPCSLVMVWRALRVRERSRASVSPKVAETPSPRDQRVLRGARAAADAAGAGRAWRAESLSTRQFGLTAPEQM